MQAASTQDGQLQTTIKNLSKYAEDRG